jgi:hypothetical protein
MKNLTINSFLFYFLFFYSGLALASSISLDIGQTATVFNHFAIPNTDQDRVSLPTDDTLTSFRVTGYFDLSSGNQIYVLLAPLETEYNFTSNKNFEFADNNYTSGTDTTVKYKFNSWRLGYLWKWKSANMDYWAGFVAKVRDANIEVAQGSRSSAFDNIGLVPLASFGFDFRLFSNISIFSHTDALGASQGSAYDSQIELRLKLSSISVSLGKRILGGGADNDEVYNFAQFDSIYTRLTYSF